MAIHQKWRYTRTSPFERIAAKTRFALYGMFNATSAAVVIASGLIFFLAAVFG